MRGDDALLALEAGVDGIIVSNHGGRQMDCTVATVFITCDKMQISYDLFFRLNLYQKFSEQLTIEFLFGWMVAYEMDEIF